MRRIILNSKIRISILCLLAASSASGQRFFSPFSKASFDKYWKIESESSQFSCSFLHDTLEVVAPKGLTLWFKQKMQGDVLIEYDACVVKEKADDRLSDLNCFWMASDPYAKDIWQRMKWRNGIFNRCYSLQTYYVGYGGNSNTTTRFRRYDGDYQSFTDAQKRPAILMEYTDSAHLLKAGRWYHIQIKLSGIRTTYTINNERIVDFREPNTLHSGWFGFRTTESRVRITNFRYENLTSYCENIPLHWISDSTIVRKPITFGVPFRKGDVNHKTRFQLTSQGKSVSFDHWRLASWPDGSAKWEAFAAVMGGKPELRIMSHGHSSETNLQHPVNEPGNQSSQRYTGSIPVSQKAMDNASLVPHFTAGSNRVLDSITFGQHKVIGPITLICRDKTEMTGHVDSVVIERSGRVRTLYKVCGCHQGKDRRLFPFTLRFYFYKGSRQVRLIHTFIYDGDQDSDYIKGLGLSVEMPMKDSVYNRYVAFSTGENTLFTEPVQPLVARHPLPDGIYRQQMMHEPISPIDERTRSVMNHLASWDGYQLSQLTSGTCSIRKRTSLDRPWIGTMEGYRSNGYAFAGSRLGGVSVVLRHFWQQYPAEIDIDGMRTNTATMTIWLWSPRSEAMDLRHYDHVAHGLDESYEDVQEGMSTPYGIAHTSELVLLPSDTLPSVQEMLHLSKTLSSVQQLLPTPAYLHANRAFGVWSLPDTSDTALEPKLDSLIAFYQEQIDRAHWYGFWNYGDFMHTFDHQRGVWRYDVGGYAWDNTELATNGWLWYMFLRSGRADIWRMAEAMSRHTCETDVYHIGPNAMLGSRHNVSHWGCGAKEARISQAAWNRYLYYLTADERSGDLMTEVRDADSMLYKLDPMRLAQPRSKYPCTAPARLRVGPDWLAYAGNWMTEWERTGNVKYRDKILAGMHSIAALPHGFFTGPKVLGYDPKTGVVSYEGDTSIVNTNHLMTIMGGFEINHELMELIPDSAWQQAWLYHAANYTKMLYKIGENKFLLPRLTAYGAYYLHDPLLARQAWRELRRIYHPYANDDYSTNDAATWSLSAIYLKEVLPRMYDK